MTRPDAQNPSVSEHTEALPKPLPAAAKRALDEAAQRRAAAKATSDAKPVEVGGPSGPEPTRYGDWEKGGLISDF